MQAGLSEADLSYRSVPEDDGRSGSTSEASCGPRRNEEPGWEQSQCALLSVGHREQGPGTSLGARPRPVVGKQLTGWRRPRPAWPCPRLLHLTHRAGGPRARAPPSGRRVVSDGAWPVTGLRQEMGGWHRFQLEMAPPGAEVALGPGLPGSVDRTVATSPTWPREKQLRPRGLRARWHRSPEGRGPHAASFPVY